MPVVKGGVITRPLERLVQMFLQAPFGALFFFQHVAQGSNVVAGADDALGIVLTAGRGKFDGGQDAGLDRFELFVRRQRQAGR